MPNSTLIWKWLNYFGKALFGNEKQKIMQEDLFLSILGWFVDQLFQFELRRNTISSIAFISCLI